MRIDSERQQLNRFLGRTGLAQLDEPAALVQQMATLVRDHDHFRGMLEKCEPELRYQMYEALAPRLRFPAKMLGDYMIESAQIAEQRQWPTVAADGTLLPFKPVNVETNEYIAEQAIKAEKAKERLWIVCRKCTKEALFLGARKADCIHEARVAGWTYDEVNGTGREICPDCP